MSESPQQTAPGTSVPDSIVIDTDIIEDGRPIQLCLRPLSVSDHDRIERGIMGLSEQSRYLRFFSGFKAAPKSLVEQLTAVDGVNHIGWGAVNLGIEGQPAMGAVHAIRQSEDETTGEFAIAVLDQYHGKGVARALVAALFLNCVRRGMRELDIAVMRENTKGAHLVSVLTAKSTHSDGPVVYSRLDLQNALNALRAMENPYWLQEVFAAFGE
ncbi:GNAT family N-acetyltransferase [Parasphingorhabdus sp.]|uniref:GNAT family N-acetyltransferase n=1 Tax=Parasphingorhabdus sp. TaxID=2709688 RepID=UPI002F925738